MELIFNGETTTFERGGSVKDFIESLGLPEKGIAVERNLEIVPKSAYADTQLESGDKLEIIQFVGGG